jgi:hypothetical protein
MTVRPKKNNLSTRQKALSHVSKNPDNFFLEKMLHQPQGVQPNQWLLKRTLQNVSIENGGPRKPERVKLAGLR